MSKPEIDVSELNPEDHLQGLKGPWESLSEYPDEVPVTRAQQKELDRKIDELESHEGFPWDELLEQIRQRHR